MAPPPVPTFRQEHLSGPHPSSSVGPLFPPLVVFRGDFAGKHLHRTISAGPHDGCQPDRLGGAPAPSYGPGPVDGQGSSTQHQLPGIAGRALSPPCLSTSGGGSGHSSPYRQHVNQSAHKQNGGHSFQGSAYGDHSAGSLGRIPSILHPGGPHFRDCKPASGRSQPLPCGSRGVESVSPPLSGNCSSVRVSSRGSVRLSCEPSPSEILLSIPRSSGGGYQRPPLPVASRPSLRISPPSPHPSSAQEDVRGESGAPPCGPTLASSALVRGPGVPICGAPLAHSGFLSATDTRPPHVPRSNLASLDRMEVERGLLTAHRVPPPVVSTMQAARRPSTKRIYGATWNSFVEWCSRSGLDPLMASVLQVLSFLQAGFEAGLAPNTLRRQVAALASVLSCGSPESLSHHPFIRTFLRGATNLRPPVVHRFPTWDLNKVLTALTLSPFEPLRQVSLRFLSFKVSFLVAITSARRISELAALSTRSDLCIFHTDRVVLRLDPAFLPKINTLFHRAQEIVLPNFCPRPTHRLERSWHLLDVRRALRIYLSRTAPLRKTEALFVSFQPETVGARVSSPTLGRWIRATIATAYQQLKLPVPRNITAHSTRSAATSAAWATRAPLEEVCRAATWTSISPFIRHYRVDAFASADAAFGRRVLQAVLSS